MNSRKLNKAIKETKGFKEQTYITAEDYINSQDNFLGRDWRNDDKELAKAFKEFSKHNEETKVLEALEREFKKIDVQYYESGFGNKEQGGKYYYETEVKPKYIKSI